MTTNPNYSKPSKIGKDCINGIIIDGKVYETKQGECGKDKCSFWSESKICAELCDYCAMKKCYFRYSQPLTDKINEK